MAAAIALYESAYVKFTAYTNKQYSERRDQKLLADFLQERSNPYQTQHVAQDLIKTADSKYGSELGPIPGSWMRVIGYAKERDSMKSLLINEADTKDGLTALHHAAIRASVVYVRELLNNGADVNVKNEKVLVCAALESIRLLKQLYKFKADLTKADNTGGHPFYQARRYRHATECADVAIEVGGLHIKYEGGKAEDVSYRYGEDRALTVSAEKPLSASIDEYCFEMKVNKLGDGSTEYPEVAVRFWWVSRAKPGATSWGCYSDNGSLRHSNKDDAEKMDQAWHYSQGDTVGCGVDFNKHEIWSARNGERLDYTFSNVRCRLVPVIGLTDRLTLTALLLFKGNVERVGDNSGALSDLRKSFLGPETSKLGQPLTSKGLALSNDAVTAVVGVIAENTAGFTAAVVATATGSVVSTAIRQVCMALQQLIPEPLRRAYSIVLKTI
ncbi:hypothetical protein F5Y16DRAFT_399986 [Xylariaceae sp. FL0255]|nr:hypothetical protein F5Y16DRAFT_399986 [Xylariaceae sp. FL0255]